MPGANSGEVLPNCSHGYRFERRTIFQDEVNEVRIRESPQGEGFENGQGCWQPCRFRYKRDVTEDVEFANSGTIACCIHERGMGGHGIEVI